MIKPEVRRNRAREAAGEKSEGKMVVAHLTTHHPRMIVTHAETGVLRRGGMIQTVSQMMVMMNST